MTVDIRVNTLSSRLQEAGKGKENGGEGRGVEALALIIPLLTNKLDQSCNITKDITVSIGNMHDIIALYSTVLTSTTKTSSATSSEE